MALRADPKAKNATRRKRHGGLLRRLAGRILRSVGYLLAAVLLWIGAYTVVPPLGGPYMVAEWWRHGGIERDWESLGEISPHLVRAVMAAEDARFCDHFGLDFEAIEKAIEERERGRVRGASTITQQVAKNVFLWHGRSWIRKGFEAGFALAIEAIWTKRRTLEAYLNVAEFGEGVFGAEAAAQHYWSIPASELTLAQAARLAAVLPDPKGRDPRTGSAFMSRRAAAIAEGARTLEAEGRDRCVL